MSREGGSWYISVLCRWEEPDPPAVQGLAIGVDLGVSKALALSTGEELKVEGMTPAELRKLAKLQRGLSRKVKFSKNWAKQRQKIRKLHRTVARRRHDGIHKATTYLAKNHRMVVVEDLKVVNLTKAPEPIPDPAGTHRFLPNGATAKAGLNRAILEKGFRKIRQQLTYKCPWYGSVLLAVNPAFLSQRCSFCGHTEKGNRPTQAVFRCLKCGHEENADTNAAVNILSVGLTGHTVGHTEAKRETPSSRRPAKNRNPMV